MRSPSNLKENKHYICFENLDDLVDKVRYYLANEAFRHKIAQAARELFEKEYDLKKHGLYIEKKY